MKKDLPGIILIILMLAGLSLLLYPTFSDWWNSMHQSRAIDSYLDTVGSMDSETTERMLEEAGAYNEAHFKKGNMAALTDQERAWYMNTLDITGTGIMGYLEIPSIQVYLPIYHGTDDTILQVAVGHMEATSLPVGGASTHAVLSGHRGLPSAKLLSNLDRMVEGDTFTITILNETLTYMVDRIRIVLPEEVDELMIAEGKDYVTLVTCTPYGVNTHRLLVRGRRIETQSRGPVIVSADASQISVTFVALSIAVPILAVCMLAALLIRPRVKIDPAKFLKKHS